MYHFYTIYGECSQTFYLIRWYKLHAWDIEHEPRMKTEWKESASLLALNHFLLDIIACFIAELESCSNLFGIFRGGGWCFRLKFSEHSILSDFSNNFFVEIVGKHVFVVNDCSM